MEFAFKLIKHGGIFLLRVLGIVVPAAATGMAASMVYRNNRDAPDYSENDCATAAVTGHFPDGSSCYSDVRCLKYMDD